VTDVVIGVVPDLRLQRLQTILGGLYAHGVADTFEVRHLPTSEQLFLLLDGEIDLGVIHDAVDTRGVETEPIFPGEPLVVFLPAGHRLTGLPAVGPEDLRDAVLIAAPRAADPSLADRLEASLDDLGYPIGIERRTAGSDVRDVMFLVAEGVGMALDSVAVLDGAGDLAALIDHRPLDPPVQMPDTVLAWRSDAPARMLETIAAAREVARELRDSCSGD
jgi:hypothetical protein